MVWMMKTNDAQHAITQKNLCNGSNELKKFIIAKQVLVKFNNAWPQKGPLFYKNSDSFGLLAMHKEKKVTLRETY